MTLEEAKKAGYRYVADANTKEFHSIRRTLPECNADKITEKHRQFFKTQRQAHDAGFDACGHRCVKKYRSRNNQ